MKPMQTLLRDRQAWLHSAKSYLAAVIALYVGLAFNLPKPFWAMTTAYVVMQPVLGSTRARGFYRVVGTFIAAVAVVLIIPSLLHAPVLLSAAMSLWLSACLFVALMHRGPASYVFLLAGYTAAFIGFPAVLQPDTIFDTAVARVEEITVGSLCAVIVGAVVFPVSIQPQVRQRVDALMRDAAAWCRQVLAHEGSPNALRKRMAGDLAQLDAIIPFAGRDDPRHGALDEWLRELRARMLGILPVLASIEDRLRNLGLADGEQGDDALVRLLADVRTWIGSDAQPTPDELERFGQRIDAMQPAINGTDGDALLRGSLLLRLRELVEVWYDARGLQHAITSGKSPPAPVFSIDLRRLVSIDNRHVDWGMLTFSALAAGATMFAYCLLWIWIGWPDGASGAMMAGVAAAFFAAQDDPSPSMLKMLGWMFVAMLVSGVYLFGVLPRIHDLVPLVVVTAPAFLCFGLMSYRPALFLPGMILLTNLASLLNIQNHYTINFTSFVNSSLASLLGLAFAVVMTRVFRSVGAEWTARRLVRQGWRLLADAAEGHGQQNRERFLVRMLDLLGLLAPRMAALPVESDIATVDMLDEARVGLNILNLRRVRGHLPEDSHANVNGLLAGIAAHYRQQQRAGRKLLAPVQLKTRLDASLARLGSLPPGEVRDESLLGLVGLRIGLFPQENLRK